jgi:hypothetical protein
MWPNPFFVKNMLTTYCGIAYSKIWDNPIDNQKTAPSKEPPNWLKFAKSGHPGEVQERNEAIGTKNILGGLKILNIDNTYAILQCCFCNLICVYLRKINVKISLIKTLTIPYKWLL